MSHSKTSYFSMGPDVPEAATEVGLLWGFNRVPDNDHAIHLDRSK